MRVDAVVDGGVVVAAGGQASGGGGGGLGITDWIVAPQTGVLLPAVTLSDYQVLVSLPALRPSHHNHKPFIDDDLPEYDGVLHQREEDEEHAGQQPDLQGCHRVRHGDTGGGGVEHIY